MHAMVKIECLFESSGSLIGCSIVFAHSFDLLLLQDDDRLASRSSRPF